MSDEEGGSPGRGSKRNIILGYAEVRRFADDIGEIKETLAAVLEGKGETARRIEDQETRLRALEAAVQGIVAGAGASSKVWLFVYGALVAVPSWGVAILTLLSKL